METRLKKLRKLAVDAIGHEYSLKKVKPLVDMVNQLQDDFTADHPVYK